MDTQFTAAVERIFLEAFRSSCFAGSQKIEMPALLLALLSEPECRAASTLAEHGIDTSTILQKWPELAPSKKPGSTPDVPLPDMRKLFSTNVKLALRKMDERLAEFPFPLELGTEHVLLGLANAEHQVAGWLQEQGIDPEVLETEISRLYGSFLPEKMNLPEPASSGNFSPVPLEKDGPDHGKPLFPKQAPPLSDQVPLLRLLDAAMNRAREGLRVVEDFVRFTLDDAYLTGELKQLRHRLAETLSSISLDQRLAARETQADVGTQVSTSSERERCSLSEVLTANFMRLQESLRSLEEFGKVFDADMGAKLEQIRYQAYTLHRAVQSTQSNIQRLSDTRLYVLLDGMASSEEFTAMLRLLVENGADAIQLRDKQLDDRQLLQRARLMKESLRDTQVLMIVNDRPDLAVLAGADGVHVGQEELTVKDVRTLVGPDMLVGVSTHHIEQARQAVLDGANYLGIGPMFPSKTKQFSHFPGLEFAGVVAQEIRLPAFAIGGIELSNAEQILATGISQVAVGSAITAADEPAQVVRELVALLDY